MSTPATTRPELEHEAVPARYEVRVATVDGRGVARVYISSALSAEEAEEAAKHFTAWYHALPGGMNAR